MTKNLKIAFMGTPDFAVPALEMLHGAGHEIVAVYTQPPRPKGRGMAVQPSPVQQYAEAYGIPVFHPKSLKSQEAQLEFAAHKVDVAVVAAYGLLLPKAVLDAPKYGCLNIHASLLPRWRGASPIQQAIWAGDAQAGVTIMQMDEGLDTGPMIAERAVTIHPHTTATSLHDELSALGGALIVEVLKKLVRQGHLESTPQEDDKATHAPRLFKEDAEINWDQTAQQIDCYIRALNPWPGTYATLNGERIKILEASLNPSPLGEGDPGQRRGSGQGIILNRHGDILCGHNTVLRLLKIQPTNAKAMDFTAAVNGGYLKVGDLMQ